MSEKDLNQSEETVGEDSQEAPTLKPEDGDDFDDSNDEVLAQINKVTGKNYKSVEDFQKSHKALEKAVAQKGREKSEKSNDFTTDFMQELYLDKHKELKTVIEDKDLLAQAKESKHHPIEFLRKSTYWQNEAKARFAKESEKESAEEKMGKPSNSIMQKVETKENKFNKNFPASFAISQQK
jgi:hypothetical protein